MADEQDKTVTAEKPKVRIEVFAWLTRYVGGDGGGRKFYTEEFTPGESLRTVVRRVSRGFPALDHILWDPDTGQLGASVEIIVNDAFLGITHTMDSELQDGDTITLLPAWDRGRFSPQSEDRRTKVGRPPFVIRHVHIDSCPEDTPGRIHRQDSTR